MIKLTIITIMLLLTGCSQAMLANFQCKMANTETMVLPSSKVWSYQTPGSSNYCNQMYPTASR